MFTWEDKHVMVTGALGFLGSHMVKALKNERCRTVDTPPRTINLTSEMYVDRMFEGYRPNAVVHMAGLVGGIAANLKRPADFFYQNLIMGAFVMDAARRWHCDKFVVAGAGCGYPEHAPIPTKETDFWNGYPQAPSAPYSLAKRMLIVQADACHKQYGLDSVVGIPGNIYGPRDNFNLENAHVIPALVRKFVDGQMNDIPSVTVWGDGKSTRDFVYVADVCDGLIRAAEAYDTPELINLSSGVESSIEEVVALLVDITGYKGKVTWDTSRPGGQLRRCFDVSKAESIGWKAKTGLAQGLAETVEWYKVNKDIARR